MEQNKVKLLYITENSVDLLKKIIAVCHNKQKASEKAIQYIIDSGHLSVLEHCYATFEITISRKVLAQITRHRHLSFTVQSSRACELENYFVPESSHHMVKEHIESCMTKYKQALQCGVPYDEASYLLPESAMCRVIVSGNFRSFFEFLPKRTCKRALKEFRDVAKDMWLELNKKVPEVFSLDRMMNCKHCTEKSCEFK